MSHDSLTTMSTTKKLDTTMIHGDAKVSSEESRRKVDPLWFLRGISMPFDEFKNRRAVLIKELEEEYFDHVDYWDTRRTALLQRIRDNANWLFQCWAYAFFHLKTQENVGYSGHVIALRKGVFGNVDEKHWNCIMREVIEFLKETYPHKVDRHSTDTQKWFYENCWLVGCRENCSAGSSMVSRVLGYADYLDDTTLDVDEIVGAGYFCATLEDNQIGEACKNALTKRDALGYDVINGAINGFRVIRGNRSYRDGYWCYNSFRRGIDLVFRVNEMQKGTCEDLEIAFRNVNERLRSSPVDGRCRFRLEDIVVRGCGQEIQSIKQIGHTQNLLTDEIKDGYELLMGMLDNDRRIPVAFAARVTATLHPLILVNSKEFECERLSGGIWIVGYDANESNAYILSGYKEKIFAAYLELTPTKYEQNFSYRGNLQFKYKSSYQERTVVGIDVHFRIFEKESEQKFLAFTKGSVLVYRGGEQSGDPIVGNNEDIVSVMSRDLHKYVFVPPALNESVLKGISHKGCNWEYVPYEQTSQEVAITGVRKGEIFAEVNGKTYTMLVEVELENDKDTFWIEDRGICQDSHLMISDDNKLESHKLCVVPARRCVTGTTGRAIVKCIYHERSHNEELDLADINLSIGMNSLSDFLECVTFKDVRKRDVRYNVLKVPLGKILRNRTSRPQACEKDCLEAGSQVRVTVLNAPQEVVFSRRDGIMGIYVPQSEREKTLLLVSDKWLDEQNEMQDCPDVCKAIRLADLGGSKDGWLTLADCLVDFGGGGEIYGIVLPNQFVGKAMENSSLFKLLEGRGDLKWNKVRSATIETEFRNFEIVEKKLEAVGALNGENGFANAVRALLGRGLSPETFLIHWRTIGKDRLVDFLDQSLQHEINFLAVGGCDGDKDRWYRKTWLSEVFEELSRRELGAGMSSEELEEIFKTLYSFQDPDLKVPRLRRAEVDRRNKLKSAQEKVAPVVNALQGDSQVLSSALAAFLLESDLLINPEQRNAWPRRQENCQEFQDRTKTWRKSGVAPLVQLARIVNNSVPLDIRIWPLRGDGRGNCIRQLQRDCFVGQNRITDICRGPLEVESGTVEECRTLAEEAKGCCDTGLPESLRTSCVTGVLSGIFDNIGTHSLRVGQQGLRAELLFVTVFISRMAAFLNGRAKVVSDESMHRVLEIVRKAFHDARAWKLVMFYTTAADLLVWFGTKVDSE